MTAKTRRRLIVSLVTVALTLPAETILLQALSTPSPQLAARHWVAKLSAQQTIAASRSMQAYPFAYRREIMRRLSPAERAAVWRNHIQGYIDAHPGLDESITALLYNAASLATPEEFAKPTDIVRGQVGVIAERIKVLLGKDQADYLFYRLGPSDGTISGAEPIAERLTNYVRTLFVVEARDEDCDCSSNFGCDGAAHCTDQLSCNRDEDWPMCGWFWNQTCDGLCVAGIE
jgi:hypothetical protein